MSSEHSGLARGRETRRPGRVWTALTVYTVAALGSAAAAGAQIAPSTRCGVGLPASEATGYVPLPRGDVFCPLVADPKGPRSFVSYVRETSDDGDVDMGSVGITDSFGILRFGGPRPGDGFQITLTGSVFAQFDLNTASYDLINTDFIIGLPLHFRRGAFSTRLRIYHQSSHLGDEFILREDDPDFERENLSFESAEIILSVDAGPLRIYGGGEYLFNRSPETLEESLAHAGLELRPTRRLLRFGALAGARFVAAVDVKSSEEQEWDPAVSVKVGLEFDRPRDTDPPSRRWGLFFEGYDGPSPYGQFYRRQVRYIGGGVHFTL